METSSYKRMGNLTNSRMLPTNTILDEEGQTVKIPEEKLARWQRHFAKVLNVQNIVVEDVVSKLENHSHGKLQRRQEEKWRKQCGSRTVARQQDRMKVESKV